MSKAMKVYTLKSLLSTAFNNMADAVSIRSELAESISREKLSAPAYRFRNEASMVIYRIPSGIRAYLNGFEIVWTSQSPVTINSFSNSGFRSGILEDAILLCADVQAYADTVAEDMMGE